MRLRHILYRASNGYFQPISLWATPVKLESHTRRIPSLQEARRNQATSRDGPIQLKTILWRIFENLVVPRQSAEAKMLSMGAAVMMVRGPWVAAHVKRTCHALAGRIDISSHRLGQEGPRAENPSRTQTKTDAGMTLGADLGRILAYFSNCQRTQLFLYKRLREMVAAGLEPATSWV